MNRTLASLAIAGLFCLAAPAVAGAAPGGTWTPDPDLTRPNVNWTTGGDPAVRVVRVVVTQDVISATTGVGGQCAVGAGKREVLCQVGIAGGPPAAAAGTISIQTGAAVGCADTFPLAVDRDGRGNFEDGSAVTPAENCPVEPGPGEQPGPGDQPGPGEQPGPPPPPGTGDVNTTVGAGLVVAQPRFPVIVGAGPGGGPHVKTFAGGTLAETASFLAFDANFQGGVRVAVGDVNGDGRADAIAGAGPGAGPHVKVFDGATGALVRSFFAYSPAFAGGVFVAAGDVNGDGRADVITGAGPGAGPHVKVFDGVSGAELKSFFAYSASFNGGVTVAGGDVNGDGKDDIVTGAGPGAGPHVKVFNGVSGAELLSFNAFDPGFGGGVFVAAADVSGDEKADVVVGAGTGNVVRVFNGVGGAQYSSFFAGETGFAGGVRVAAGDVNGDGRPDVIVGAGPGGGPHVRALDAVTGAPLRAITAFAPGFTGGVFVGGGDPESVAAPRPRATTLNPARGTFKLKVECPARALTSCRGKVRLFGPVTTRAPRAARTTPPSLGSGSFTIAPGKTGNAAMKLNATGRKELNKRGKLVVAASILSKDAAGNATRFETRVTLKAAKKKRR